MAASISSLKRKVPRSCISIDTRGARLTGRIGIRVHRIGTVEAVRRRETKISESAAIANASLTSSNGST